jgi:hypothetical protein
MPTVKTRVTAIPDFDALAVIGCDLDVDGQTGIVNGPTRRLACLIEHAAKTIKLSRAEWNTIADAMNNTEDLREYFSTEEPAGLLIRENLEWKPDVGAKWGVRLKSLIKKVDAMTPIQHEAILSAIRWAWRLVDKWDYQTTEWWTPAFRRKTGTWRYDDEY